MFYKVLFVLENTIMMGRNGPSHLSGLNSSAGVVARCETCNVMQM
jgi:hypothetical protein